MINKQSLDCQLLLEGRRREEEAARALAESAGAACWSVVWPSPTANSMTPCAVMPEVYLAGSNHL